MEKKDFSFDDHPELVKMIESFMVSYLDITNTIAYLFVTKTRHRKYSESCVVRPFFTERLMLDKIHKEYFESYIAYAEKLLHLKNCSTCNDQYKCWQYIKQCVDKYNMKSDKPIPEPIEEYYQTLKRAKKKK